jgi:hypothetical protein
LSIRIALNIRCNGPCRASLLRALG